MRFILEGEPIVGKRARASKGIFYDPQSHIKKNLKWDIAIQMRQNEWKRTAKAPLRVELYLHMAIPKSWSQKRIKEVSENNNWHIAPGDVDNFFKFHLDMMNGIVYEDDRCIVQLYGEKKYSKNPRTEIIVIDLQQPMIENKK